MTDMVFFLSRPFGLDIDALTAGTSLNCLPDEAVEKSVNGGLRSDPCRCRFADHSQPLDETDENSGGTRRLHTVGQLARRLCTGKCISYPGFNGLEKAPDATI